jgi:Na+/melibiose symporter-like transporter
MTLEKIERQVLLWNKAAILAPIFFTGLLMVAWLLSFCSTQTLFFIACALYFLTAVIWWWWTMTSIRLLVKTLTGAQQGVVEVAQELRNIREELSVDNFQDK